MSPINFKLGKSIQSLKPNLWYYGVLGSWGVKSMIIVLVKIWFFWIHTFLSISKLFCRYIITIRIFDYLGIKTIIVVISTMIQICTVIDHALGGGIYFDHAWSNIHLVMYLRLVYQINPFIIYIFTNLSQKLETKKKFRIYIDVVPLPCHQHLANVNLWFLQLLKLILIIFSFAESLKFS